MLIGFLIFFFLKIDLSWLVEGILCTLLEAALGKRSWGTSLQTLYSLEATGLYHPTLSMAFSLVGIEGGVGTRLLPPLRPGWNAGSTDRSAQECSGCLEIIVSVI